MNLDLGSFAFGSSLNSGGGTPSWGTALGQSQPAYKFTYPGAEAILIGMLYCSVPQDRVTLPLGKGGAIYNASDLEECQLTSLFRKVYINGISIDYPFVMVLIKESSDSHPGRKSIKYSSKNTYSYNSEKYSNIEFIKQARIKLGLKENACWFVYAMDVKFQDELHMYSVIVNATDSETYQNSQTRRNHWINLLPEEETNNKNIGIMGNVYSNDLQIIFYGAPGTGKSHVIKEMTEGEAVIRTTFHPDSDYSTFVGAYKPATQEETVMTVIGTKAVPVENEDGTIRKENKIVYEFVNQAFLQAYINAWKLYADDEQNPKKQYLVIEEINRGNCAQIFGDLFQLLDRNDVGFSEYPIKTDSDMEKQLAKEFKSMTYLECPTIAGMSGEDVARKIRNGEIMLLPPNLYVWATMNTSDQSLFPIDSAFKRRWDWKYLPIEDAGKGWKIKVNDHEYDWYEFLKAINKEVIDLTHSEDKQLGYFFAKAKNGIVDSNTLVNKVYFYLWNDVFKDYDIEGQKAFKKANSNDVIAFKDFFEGMNVIESVAEQVLINLGLNKPEDPQNENSN